MDDLLLEIKDLIEQIEEDSTVPKSIKLRMKQACLLLEDNNFAISVRVDKSLQCLDELEEDPNIPAYTRTQIWNIVSRLESI
tara:strand:- start:2880 stop:3125 length:246 start_codon:yes stop_codon:yes gene_type:complete